MRRPCITPLDGGLVLDKRVVVLGDPSSTSQTPDGILGQHGELKPKEQKAYLELLSELLHSWLQERVYA